MVKKFKIITNKIPIMMVFCMFVFRDSWQYSAKVSPVKKITLRGGALRVIPSGSPLRSRSWIPAGGFYILKISIRGNSFMCTGRVCHVHALPGHNFHNFHFPVIPQAILRLNSSSPTIFYSEKWFQSNLAWILHDVKNFIKMIPFIIDHNSWISWNRAMI